MIITHMNMESIVGTETVNFIEKMRRPEKTNILEWNIGTNMGWYIAMVDLRFLIPLAKLFKIYGIATENCTEKTDRPVVYSDGTGDFYFNGFHYTDFKEFTKDAGWTDKQLAEYFLSK